MTKRKWINPDATSWKKIIEKVSQDYGGCKLRDVSRKTKDRDNLYVYDHVQDAHIALLTGAGFNDIRSKALDLIKNFGVNPSDLYFSTTRPGFIAAETGPDGDAQQGWRRLPALYYIEE